jgi:hypothetical protein
MSLITELKIPPTTSYPKLKEFILSNKQPWHLDYYCGENLNDKNDVWEDGKDIPQYNNCVISRPYFDTRVPRELGNNHEHYTIDVVRNVEQILEYNQIRVGCIFRVSVNMIPYQPADNSWGSIHVDHKFPHQNLLIYLTPKCTTGGDVRVYEDTYTGSLWRPPFEKYETFTPTEDSAITFNGMNFHHGQAPTTPNERRVFIVATYCTELR